MGPVYCSNGNQKTHTSRKGMVKVCLEQISPDIIAILCSYAKCLKIASACFRADGDYQSFAAALLSVTISRLYCSTISFNAFLALACPPTVISGESVAGNAIPLVT